MRLKYTDDRFQFFRSMRRLAGKRIAAVLLAALAAWCRPVSAEEYVDDGCTVITVPMVRDPSVVILSDLADPGNRIELSSDEYPRSPDDVFLLFSGKSDEGERFARLFRVKEDLVRLTMRFSAPGVADSAALMKKLRAFAWRNHANYVRDITMICDKRYGGACMAVSGICGFGTNENQFNIWSVEAAKGELADSTFMEKYRLVSGRYDHGGMSAGEYHRFVEDYETLKRKYPESYADFLGRERSFMRAIARCGIRNIRTLEETVYVDLPKTVIDRSASTAQ